MQEQATVPTDSGNSGGERARLISHLLHGWLVIGLGLMLVGAAFRDYRLAQTFPFLRVQFLVAEIVAGAGIAWCFGGAMHFVDLALEYRRATGERLRWYWRLLLVVQKRLLLLAQFAAAALVVGLIVAIIFGWRIPGVG
jgi:hypothetical protein